MLLCQEPIIGSTKTDDPELTMYTEPDYTLLVPRINPDSLKMQQSYSFFFNLYIGMGFSTIGDKKRGSKAVM